MNAAEPGSSRRGETNVLVIESRPISIDRQSRRYGVTYRFLVMALETTRNAIRLKIAIGVLCMSMTVLAVIMQFNPLGPQGLWPRVVHGIAAGSALLVGLAWIVRPWPTRPWAIAFVFWADTATAVGGSMSSQPVSQLGATNHLALIGIFAAFLLGWRVLAAHCLFATAVITALTLWNLHTGAATLSELYVYNAPAYSNVVFLPIVIQAVIEGVRKSVHRNAIAAHRDPLTGLLNRRGVQSAMKARLRREPRPAIVAVFVVDIDCFKELNDTYGHDVGDSTLKRVADTLATGIHNRDIAARIGGDEFMIVAFLDRSEDVDTVRARICDSSSNTPDVTVSISVGSAWQYTHEEDFTFESLSREADFGLYEAKRTRKNRHVPRSCTCYPSYPGAQGPCDTNMHVPTATMAHR
ncbi:putative diguanylate cyclase AdrA [Mycobacteroides salmoniphilum]|uniref:Putative diguanylate cyclase AdrA n=2 Tax=Mycobacteroides salmoniphilum TaxID=404941 RepID=A0A4R8SYL4_9MYCO|nr:putative diguanylate cyclase AdrA [Mycobacteroides salmoniphilum]